MPFEDFGRSENQGIRLAIMQVSAWKKVALGAVATVLLGALGSGLWDLALRPGGQWLGHAILTGVTLGSGYMRDQVYVEAAMGYHEESAMQSSSMLFALMFWFCAAFAGLMLGMTSRKGTPKTLEAEKDAQPAIDTQEIKVRGPGKGLRVSFCFFVVGSLLSLGGHLTIMLKTEAANSAHTYFVQSLTICRPYLEVREAQILESRFASIRGRTDYIAITSDLVRIAELNHLKLPYFKPW
jgi:hypothetical protein